MTLVLDLWNDFDVDCNIQDYALLVGEIFDIAKDLVVASVLTDQAKTARLCFICNIGRVLLFLI
jgi:hypothetical protein